MRLTSIHGQSASPGSAPATPAELLLDCHARIRHFVQLSRTLASNPQATDEEVADAAAALFRYFTLALPMHEADENITLFPRIRAAQPPEGLVRQAAETMLEQHKAIEELLVEFLPICSALDRNPGRLPVLAPRLQHVTLALERIFTAHLHMEETVIFPALGELFSAQQNQVMLHEMQERRQPPPESGDSSGIHLVR